MRTSFLVVLLGSVALLAGIVVYLSRERAPLSSPPVAGPAPATASPRPFRVETPNEEPPRTPPPNADQAARSSVDSPASSEADPGSTVTPIPPPTPFSRAIDTLVSSQASFEQKHAAWKQLQDADQLDQAVEALKQGAAENPTSAAYPATLGQAQLHKAGVVLRNGGTISEMGILGMQADQSFDAALKLDPANWEAQFFKAAAMSHWPLELNKGEEVIQRLSSLIDQQDTLSPQPEFAQTYVVLGDQYQKMGRPEYAAASWRIGAQKFPGNQLLQQKINGQ